MILITLPMPDRNLSLNGRMHWRQQRAGQIDQQQVAQLAAVVSLRRQHPEHTQYPLYPADKVSVLIDVERKKRGQVWDASACVEAVKGYMDGLEGWVYTNDQQIRSYAVRWDARPTGSGLIHLYIRSLRESQGWPAVAWATEEW